MEKQAEKQKRFVAEHGKKNSQVEPEPERDRTVSDVVEKTARQIKDPNEAINWLISIVNSPYQRAKLLNNVQGVCGLREPDLEVILKEVKQMEPFAARQLTVDDVFFVVLRLHTSMTAMQMTIQDCRGEQSFQAARYQMVLGLIARVAERHNRLDGFAPGFFTRHETKAVRKLVAQDAATYGWLTNCIVLDCTDELIEGTSNPYLRNATYSAKPKTSHSAVTYLRAHLHDMYALWTSPGFPPNEFSAAGESNVDTHIANKSDFWHCMVALADSQAVDVIHILADKAYRYLEPPVGLQTRFQVHLLGVPKRWNAAHHPRVTIHQGDQVVTNLRLVVERGNRRLKEMKALASIRLHSQLPVIDMENLAASYLSNFKMLLD